MSITAEAPRVSVPQLFNFEQQVIAHLPYGMNGGLIPVVGVVLVPGALETVIRIRDRDRNLVEKAVPNDQLSAR